MLKSSLFRYGGREGAHAALAQGLIMMTYSINLHDVPHLTLFARLASKCALLLKFDLLIISF